MRKKSELKDMGITIIGTESLISVRQTRPPLLEQDGLVTIGSPTDEQLQILVGPDAFATINAQATSDLYHEVGGFLVGRPYKWKGQMYVEIVGALPSEPISPSAVHLTISHDTWAQAQARVREQFPDVHIVGWYHTHPRMYVFMSQQDIAIHKGFFREPWHVSLVVEPSRREAGFFVWDDEQVQPASGYQVAYPTDMPADEGWRPPRPLDTELDARPVTLDDFYTVGSWRTRWAEPDEVAVKIWHEAMSTIHRQTRSRTRMIFNFCLGWVHANESGDGPRFFVEVIDVLPDPAPYRAKGLDPQYIVDLGRKLMGSVKRHSRLSVVGWYWFRPRSRLPMPVLYKRIHKGIFTKPWHIVLTGDSARGVERCEWQGASGEFVTRQLVEMVSLDELAGDGLRRTLSTIKEACQKA